jgi:hypothetical protein
MLSSIRIHPFVEVTHKLPCILCVHSAGFAVVILSRKDNRRVRKDFTQRTPSPDIGRSQRTRRPDTKATTLCVLCVSFVSVVTF